MIKKTPITIVVAAAVACAAVPATAQDFSYENCECVDGILYCYERDAPSSQYTPDYDYSPQSEETYEPATVREYQTPDYAPPQTYEASYPSTPSYSTSSSDAAPRGIPPEVALALLILLAAGLIAAACSSSTDAPVEQDIEETRALTEKLEAAAREADAHIAAFLEKAGSHDGEQDV